MPLRDHFRPPVSSLASWEGFHGMWPMTMIQALNPKLPEEYMAEPRVHLGPFLEVDECAYVDDVSSPPQPTLTCDAGLTEHYAYEVLIKALRIG